MSTESLGPETIFSFGKYKGQTFIYVYDNDAKYVNWVKSLPDPSGKMLEFLNFVNEHEMCKNVNANVKYSSPKQTKLDKSFTISPRNDVDLSSKNKVTLESNFVKRKELLSPVKPDFDSKRVKMSQSPTPGDRSYFKEEIKREKEELSPSLQHILKVLEMDKPEEKPEILITIEGCLALVLFSEEEFYLSYTKSRDNTGWWSCYLPSEVFSAISNMGVTLNTKMVGKQKFITFKAEDYNTVLKGLRAVIKNRNRIESVPNFILRTFPEFRIFSRELEMTDKTKEILQGIQDEYTQKNINKMKMMIGENLWEKLLPFQKQGVSFGLERNGRVLIGDEMGLGKTLQALAISAFYQEDWPLLIICPSSIRFQWVDQCVTWLPHLVREDEVFMVKTSKSMSNLCKNMDREEEEEDNWNLEEIREESPTAADQGKVSDKVIRASDLEEQSIKIVVISYDLVVKMKNLMDFKIVICDESHYLKNRTSQRSRRIVPMLKEAKRAILLSGTPAVNNPSELFEQLSSIIPGFSCYNVFVERYCNKKLNFFTKKMDYSGSKHARELHHFLVRTVMIRRLKDEVMKELPPKIRSKVPIEISDRVIRATKMFFEEYNYNSLLKNTNADINIGDLIGGSEGNTGNKDNEREKETSPKNKSGKKAKSKNLSKEEELWFNDLDEEEGDGEKEEGKSISMTQELFMVTGRAKIKGVCNYVEEILENENKFIIFAHHIFMLDAIEETLKNKKVAYIRIDGSTNINERARLVQEFQNTTNSSSDNNVSNDNSSNNNDNNNSDNNNDSTNNNNNSDNNNNSNDNTNSNNNNNGANSGENMDDISNGELEEEDLGVAKSGKKGKKGKKDSSQGGSDKGGKREVRVALLSLTACGVGLNLTSSSTVIFAELFWSPSKLLQAEDRVHRIGTTANTINIHYLIAQNSIDDVIWKIVNNKQMNLSATLDGAVTNISITNTNKKK